MAVAQRCDRDFLMYEEEISTMTKRILASVLCLVMLVSALGVLSSCGDSDKKVEDKGQYLTMYLSEQVYDLDPANAYYNDATTGIVNLLFETLFKVDDNGKVKKSLVKKYVINEDAAANEYTMDIYLNDTCWSDGVYVSANDVVYAWKRLLDVESSYDAAALLFDIKNARSVKEGDMSIDDLCIYAEGELMVSVEFEGPIDYDQFILNLTSVALAPLREDIAAKPDWAKKPATIVCSGPFKLGRVDFVENSSTKYFDASYEYEKTDGTWVVGKDFKESLIKFLVLERNAYYYRDVEKEEKLDKFVTPYRIIVDFSMTDDQLAAAYDAGAILYIDNIPYSWRYDEYFADLIEDADVTDAMSNHTYYFNQNALIDDGGEGEYLFANKTVRSVLSRAIDRQAIVDAIVFAEAATGVVPNGVFDTNSKKTTFREAAQTEYANLSTVSVDELKSELSAAGIKANKYSFSITVAAYDEIHVAIAEMVAEQWNALGFDVSVNKRGTIANNDYYKWTDSVPDDICDDLYAEDLRSGNFEVIALDLGAVTMDAYATLAPFAKAFSGQGMDMSDSENYQLSAHITGFDNEKYNDLIEAVYFLQYYENFKKFFYNTAYGTDYFDSEEAANAVYDKITAVYQEYGITPSAKTYLEDRATLLHAAEEILMEEVPVAPIIANKYASLTNSGIKKIKSTYTNPLVLTMANASGYKSYLQDVEDFLEANFQAYAEDRQSYIYDKFKGNDKVYVDGEFSWEGFKGESSHYGFLFEDEE
ncbi:MAG: hypothetical protein E7594_01070 [Ruminococcaceae bacterium]|nr:hypothetical protein [Oscillospiraceae bacterium]